MNYRKSVICAMVGMFGFFASGTVHAESFDELLRVDSAIEIDRINAVNLAERSFDTPQYAQQYADARAFLSALKSRLVSYYADERISYYRINDVIISMRSLATDLDTYFLALDAYEASGNTVYRDVYEYKRTDIRESYARLANQLRGSLSSGEEDEQGYYESGYDDGSYKYYRYYR